MDMKVNSPANIQAMLETLKKHELEVKQGIQQEDTEQKEIPQYSSPMVDETSSPLISSSHLAQNFLRE